MGHTNRHIAEGNDFWAFIETGTTQKTYKPIASQTSCSISDDSDQLESTSKNVGNFANYQYGRERWSATLEMFITDDTNIAEVSFDELRLMRKAKQKPTLFFAFVDANGDLDTSRRAYRGQAIMKMPITANDGELQKATINFQGCLELEYLEYETDAWTKVTAP